MTTGFWFMLTSILARRVFPIVSFLVFKSFIFTSTLIFFLRNLMIPIKIILTCIYSLKTKSKSTIFLIELIASCFTNLIILEFWSSHVLYGVTYYIDFYNFSSINCLIFSFGFITSIIFMVLLLNFCCSKGCF